MTTPLTLHLESEHQRLSLDGDGLTHAVISLTGASLDVAEARPPLRVVFLLDTSGSMHGEPLRQVKDSVERLIGLLRPTDSVGAVVFAANASVLSPPQPLDEMHRAHLRRRLSAVEAGGGTALSTGIGHALAQFSVRDPDAAGGARQVVMVLTDGKPTDGTTVASLAPFVEEARDRCTVVTLGYGAHHDGDLLTGIAKAGGGQYWFIPDPAEASLEFARAIGSQADIVAERVQLQLVPGEDVEILGVVDGARPRFGANGLTIDRPDLTADEVHHTVVALKVDLSRRGQEAGRQPLLEVLARARPAGGVDIQETRSAVDVDVIRGPSVLNTGAAVQVALAHAENERVRARKEADVGRFDGAAIILKALQSKLEALPGYQRLDGSPLSEAVEQIVDEVVAYESRPSSQQYLEFRSTQLGVDLGQGASHVADRKLKSSSAKVLIQGERHAPFEWQLVEAGREDQWHRAAGSEVTVGRVAGNDVVISSGSISKRHARIVHRDGQLIVVDLKTTNGTWLNGERISTPKVVHEGDEIRVGNATLRLRLAKKP